MNDPVVFKDPASGSIMEVCEARVVTVQDIDVRIAEHQTHIERLQTLRAKVESFDQPAPAVPADQPAEQPVEPQAPEGSTPLEVGTPPPIAA